MKRLALLLTLLLSFSFALTPAQEARVQRLGDGLRCPVCRGLPITESPNQISAQMLSQVRDQVAAGRSDSQIHDYFAARFGGSVLLDPPKSGLNLALWALPAAALLGGAWLLARYLKGAGSQPEQSDPELLSRVRRDLESGTREARE